jgi:hypothetical protein
MMQDCVHLMQSQSTLDARRAALLEDENLLYERCDESLLEWVARSYVDVLYAIRKGMEYGREQFLVAKYDSCALACLNALFR